jgi:hypothetical protein
MELAAYDPSTRGQLKAGTIPLHAGYTWLGGRAPHPGSITIAGVGAGVGGGIAAAAAAAAGCV